MMLGFLRLVQSIVERGLQAAGTAISRLTKPISPSPARGIVSDLTRSKSQLVAENLLLRQQLLVLNRGSCSISMQAPGIGFSGVPVGALLGLLSRLGASRLSKSLNRSVKRPHLTRADRGLFVLLASKLEGWKDALLIVKPESVLRWHREGLQLFWRRKSRANAICERLLGSVRRE
jgi:hypothetical protein